MLASEGDLHDNLTIMEDSETFAQQLEERLEAQRSKLDRTDLVKLKENFKLFQSSFVGMRAILNKKGVLGDDPYKYDLKISDVTIPSERPFAESEKVDQMSVRVSQFEAYLDFLNNYYQFSCDFLTMGRIKRILGLVKYFNFAQCTETSTQLNTRALAEIIDLVRKGTDELSAGLIADAVTQLDKVSRDILACLRTLTDYHKERYKLDLRQIVMPGLQIDADLAIGRRDEAMRIVKRKFAEVASERPFYPELVEEILLEDFSSDAPSLREALLKKLAVVEEKKAEGAKEKSFKGVITDGIRVLASASFTLGEAVSKLMDDSALLASIDQGLGARLKRMLRKLFSPEERGLVYQVEFVDPVTGSRSTEALDFTAFVDETNKKVRFLGSFMQRGSSSSRRLEGMDEEQAYKFLQRNIEEFQRTLRFLAALEDFFKSEIPAEAKGRIKLVRSEITTIKGAVIKANQKKHEYVAQREEREQMRRLGIKEIP
jgi:hypothetical protein